MHRTALILTAALLAAPAAAFAAELVADANKDGKVTLKEYQQNRWNFLMRGDENKDGRIDKKEWDREAKALRVYLAADAIHDADTVGRGDTFPLMDTNGDRAVSQTESDAYFAKRFIAFDTNKDGFIVGGEADAAMKAVKK